MNSMSILRTLTTSINRFTLSRYPRPASPFLNSYSLNQIIRARASIGGFHDSCSAKNLAIAGEGEADGGLCLEGFESRKDESLMKILTYNVWFREDLELQERMDEIGGIIHLHSPDVICLQEVSPDIYEIFRKSSWWRLYRASVSDEVVYSTSYLCILMVKTKHLVKSFIHKPFSNTKMSRGLSIVELEPKPNKPLTIATTHLESPCPGPPKWDQMYTKERVSQAKEAINYLNKHSNVILGGDMNWDDKLDGDFLPLGGGWTDSWLDLRPTEKGYTYDTKSNKMLAGNRSLRKRLDRFVCKFEDFKVVGIEMVGTEEIPGLVYCKERKGKNGFEELMLPVLPSDHYGLLLTIDMI